ncbi:MAG: hypothetical protein IJF84_09840 [Thermoguttaceae bacterium]|nr:hypothetical protein [Thermoguttaceae bacterium]
MKKQIVLVLPLLAMAFFTGCSDQKATPTRQRWMEIKTATDNLIDAMAYTNQATSKESEDGLAEPLARATSTVNACRTYNEALSSQKTLNVDPRLNVLAEKLIESSKALLDQTLKGQEVFITAQRLQTELQTATDPLKVQQLSMEAANIINVMNSAQQMGAEALMQINDQYQELETLRLELNKQYGFELPQIKWMNQQ